MKSSTIAKVGMKPPHPGAFIREEILQPHGLNVSTGADVLGVRRATLSDLVNEKTSLSPEMALRIEKAFGVNMDMLLQMQAWHDARAMRERSKEIQVKRYKAVARRSLEHAPLRIEGSRRTTSLVRSAPVPMPR
jgi:addiction module HigA family antidote